MKFYVRTIESGGRPIRLLCAMLITTLLATVAALASATAPAAAQTADTFTAVVDYNRLSISRESDTPGRSSNPDEPTILTWTYQVMLGDASSASVDYAGHSTFSGRDARRSGGTHIRDKDGRFELPAVPADGVHITGSITVVLDSDACSNNTYRILGRTLDRSLTTALNQFAGENTSVLALAGEDDPLGGVVESLTFEPNNWQIAQMAIDCAVSFWVIPNFDFDDIIGVGATMFLGFPASEFFCDIADDASGYVGTEMLLDIDQTVTIPVPVWNPTTVRIRIQEPAEINLEVAVMDDRAFGWGFNDDDAHYTISGGLEVTSAADNAECPSPAPKPTNPEPRGCLRLMIDLEKGLIDQNTYIRLARGLGCSDFTP